MKIDGLRSGGSVKRGREQDKKAVESIKKRKETRDFLSDLDVLCKVVYGGGVSRETCESDKKPKPR
ncbi:hypothetical protein VPHK367G1_0002 [Vibrio phage K367 g1]